MRKEFPNIEKFSFVGYEENIECSLKHIFNAFLNYGTKFSQYENLSIYEWLDKYPGTNIDNKFDKPSI
jgi:type IV secretory pathway VirB6-like protein